MLNFEKSEKSLNVQAQSIQLEYERIEILSKKNIQNVLIFIDRGQQDHKLPISYKQQNVHRKLICIEPYLLDDPHYDKLKNLLSTNELQTLHEFIDEYLLKNIESTMLPEEKEYVTNGFFCYKLILLLIEDCEHMYESYIYIWRIPTKFGNHTISLNF